VTRVGMGESWLTNRNGRGVPPALSTITDCAVRRCYYRAWLSEAMSIVKAVGLIRPEETRDLQKQVSFVLSGLAQRAADRLDSLRGGAR